MSRSGPGYVNSETELFEDLDLKQKTGEVTPKTAEAFIELYEFGISLGDRVVVRGAKSANFQVKVDAHQSEYGGDPSVFSANVKGKLKVWPAKKPLENDPDLETIGWEPQDYATYEKAFQSLRGVPRQKREARFETLVANGELDRFKQIVEEFVSTCREKDLKASQ